MSSGHTARLVSVYVSLRNKPAQHDMRLAEFLGPCNFSLDLEDLGKYLMCIKKSLKILDFITYSKICVSTKKQWPIIVIVRFEFYYVSAW